MFKYQKAAAYPSAIKSAESLNGVASAKKYDALVDIFELPAPILHISCPCIGGGSHLQANSHTPGQFFPKNRFVTGRNHFVTHENRFVTAGNELVALRDHFASDQCESLRKHLFRRLKQPLLSLIQTFNILIQFISNHKQFNYDK